MYNKCCIEEKVDLLCDCIKQDGGIIDLPWCRELLYPYYDHFNDDNCKYRAGSLVAFWGLLQEWEDGSGFPFYTGVEEYKCHDFQKYLESFIKYYSKIKIDYPNIYSVIINSLRNLDNSENFESTFSYINMSLINKIREIVDIEDYKITDEVYKNAYREADFI